jgi:methionine-rich copper-binding protein CopC
MRGSEMKRGFQILTALMFSVISIAPAFSTSIVSTSPTAGSVLSIAPTAVTIKASAELSDVANEITVTDPNGVRVDDGSVQIQGQVLMVGLKPLTVSGLYTVAYTITAIADVPTVSSFTFLYNAPAEMTLATPSPSQSEVNTPTANRTTDIFVIALLIFAFIILIFLSRYAKQTFKAPVKAKKPPIRKSNSRKFLK